VDQVCESYKYKIAGEKLLERLGTHQDQDAVHSVLLKDLDPQTFRERVQDQTFIHKKKRPEFIEKRKKQMATEALVLREYNA